MKNSFSAAVTSVPTDCKKNVETNCYGCHFSIIKNNQQHGCYFNRISKYTEQGEEITIQTTKDIEHYVIHRRACTLYRGEPWVQAHSPADLFELAEIVQSEVMFKTDVVVYIDEHTEDYEINDTMKSLVEAKDFIKTVFIADNSQKNISRIMSIMHNYDIPWRIEAIIEENADLYRSIDLCTKKTEAIYVTYLVAGKTLSTTTMKKVNKLINYDLDKFIILESVSEDKISGMIVLRIFHKQAGGNFESPLTEKAKRLSEKQQCQYLVKSIAQVNRMSL